MYRAVKIGDLKYRRDGFAVERRQVVLIAITAFFRWEKLGNVLRGLLDDVQEPKLSVITDRGRRQGV